MISSPPPNDISKCSPYTYAVASQPPPTLSAKLTSTIVSPVKTVRTSNLTTVPQEILLHITKQLCILDVFILRQVCRSLYSRLSGADNQPLYYYFLTNPSSSPSSSFTAKTGAKKKRRFPYFNKRIDYFSITKDILSGKTEGCGLCLAEVKNGGFLAYKGQVLFKRVCGVCARGYFTELWCLEQTHPTVKIPPYQRITFSSSTNSHPFNDPHPHARWMGSLPRDCILNSDLKSITSSSQPLSSPLKKNIGKQAYHSRYDKQIHFAQQKKSAADIVIRILSTHYSTSYQRLHWLKPPHAFEEYLYNSLLWNLRPWLAPHYNKEKGLPKFTLGDRIEELLDMYTESEDLSEDLRLKGLKSGCVAVLSQELRVPKKGRDIRKPGKLAPLIRYWIIEWLEERNWKGVPKDTEKNLRNSPRICPFCEVEEGRGKVGCTVALTVHIWCRHEEMLEEQWRWINA
ncbi:hypothetical protein TWF569_010418 [Orbilia oligospora]|uniref:F-box domain-containing protein n=1 Tax=Orbilia oligospora TaxID=2813651 RepID=A0A7C8JL67_ORBOL|nr:hypothetical protein TWF706_006174 [Orbilia oligospora]KAF3112024.1 hypothetical protein TWF102_005772 [Orbilia oligospora]KAF3113255.1 hypothetical protein TWF103_002422 [Orbilia oligospora]KAF3126232.1 hypothetical protein TWF703_010490 [Orbilia oligospora]KAF3133731.1 hypothetical protein TWF569_010418 [Orbilia oligospora]